MKRLLTATVFAGLVLGISAQASAQYSTFYVVNVASGLCLDGYQGADGSLSLPYTNTCGPRTNPYQQWYYATPMTGSYQICNAATNKCLDGYTNPIGGNPYMQNSYPTDPYQQWYDIYLSDVGGAQYSFQNIETNTCLDGYNNGQLGIHPYLYTCSHDDSYQSWRLE